jgi:hypothetical protein
MLRPKQRINPMVDQVLSFVVRHHAGKMCQSLGLRWDMKAFSAFGRS